MSYTVFIIEDNKAIRSAYHQVLSREADMYIGGEAATAAEGLAKLSGEHMGTLIITHHERLLEYNVPQYTHVMLAGRIVETGDAALAHELHEQGYAGVRERHPSAAAEEEAARQEEATTV